GYVQLHANERGTPRPSNDDPIHLESVPTFEFEKLAWVLTTPIFRDEDFSIPTFEAILKLATMWGFNDVRTYAIKVVLKNTGSAIQIRLGLAYGVHEWLMPAYINLVTRVEPLTQEEAQDTGLCITVTLARLRDQIQRCRYKETNRKFSRTLHLFSMNSFNSEVQKEICDSDL
ncbi:hypothetical protein FRB95_013944, partial [Tulasnella sp. JGI-2019a]